MRTADLRQREVINIATAERIGFISDVEMDFEKGCVNAVIVPVRRGFWGIIRKKRDCRVPWDKITAIGKDLVLVRLETLEIID